jgi:hypothetical protein
MFNIFTESGVCARVGVTRIRARITSKSKTTDVDSRIGAFEVQAAFRNSGGEICTELLHSKLLTRHWPSKSGMEKKLKDFILKSGIATHPLYVENSSSDGEGSDGLSPYPLGHVEWEETPLSSTTWMYPVAEEATAAVVVTPNPLDLLKMIDTAPQVVSSVQVKGNSNNVDLNYNMGNCDDPESKSLNIQWVFDAREIPGIVAKGPQSIFQIQATATPAPVAMPPKGRPLSAGTSKKTSALDYLTSKGISQTVSKVSVISAIKSESYKETSVKQDLLKPENDDTDSEVDANISIPLQLKATVFRNLPKDIKDEPLVPYDPMVLVTKGIVAAETIASCQLLRHAVMKLYTPHIINGISNTKIQVADYSSVFEGLDQRKAGTLNIFDIDYTLTLMQNRRCSDEAIRLVMLSLGKSQ